MWNLSLRLRLVFVLTLMVGLLGLVGVTSYLTHKELQSDVAVFSARRSIDLLEVDLNNNRLELEGTWDPAGTFIAREVEVFPGQRRPKLRGAIQKLDLGAREMTMYGQVIALPQSIQIQGLVEGLRVEVTCDVKHGSWTADKLSITNIKSSDKIKACASSWDLDGVAPESLSIEGIQVSLIAKSEPGVVSALDDIETAISLSLCLFELRSHAYGVVGGMQRGKDELSGLNVEGDASEDLDSWAQIHAARQEFEHTLERASTNAAGASSKVGPNPNRWIAALFGQLLELDEGLARFENLARRDLSLGRAELRTHLIPFLDRELKSRLNVYLREAQNDLGDRARQIESKTRSTARMTLAVGIVATMAASVLGFLLLRSIRRPLIALEQAAKKIGKGDLSVRVEVDSPDELGALAEAFNQMSETLALTTVSIDNLQNILDSISGILILLTPERKIISVNQAAAKLLGFDPDELVGKPFACLFAQAPGAEPFVRLGPSTDVEQLALRSRKGEEVFVSFSAAELRSPAGDLRGYVCSAQDLRDQKRIEKEVRTSLQEKELLLREVHHRVKNNMQVISSLLAMQQDCSEDPSVIKCLEQGQARIRSMALIHEHLYQSADLAEADVGTYLSLLVAHISNSFGSDNSIQLNQDFDQVSLGLDHALALGLIVNELVANSYQHAFMGQKGGQIWLSLREIPEGQVQLIVSDSGPGALKHSQKRRLESLGLNLVQTLVEQLEGTTEVSYSAGRQTRITFPYMKNQELVK